MRSRQVPGGGRAVEVEVARLAGWFSRFSSWHGGVARTELDAHRVRVLACDDATATIEVPYAPLAGVSGDHEGFDISALLAHLLAPRQIGLVLVRLGGHSVGVVHTEGDPASNTARADVLAATTGNRPVHGRSAAGGTSQLRFSRRREGQAKRALDAAAADIERVVLPRCGALASVVLGGDRRALADLRERSALAPVFALASGRVLDVPEPRRAVLEATATRLLAVEVVVEP